jgi:hypothetical protein
MEHSRPWLYCFTAKVAMDAKEELVLKSFLLGFKPLP